MQAPGTLHVVATPIGNLQDASPRMAAVLSAADLVLAEDTRRTRQLLQALGATASGRILRCDDHSERERLDLALATLRQGRDVALVTDAGTPAVSDPGYRIVAAAHAAGLPVSPVPGPSSVVAALCASGLPSDAFVFEGFLPRKPGARRRFLAALADEPRTIVVLESTHRIAAALADAAEVLGPDRPAFMGREITKLHEECRPGTLATLAARAASGPLLGEIVLVIGGAPRLPDEASPEDLIAEVESLIATGTAERDALRSVAKAHGLSKRDIYRLVKIHEVADEPEDGAGDDEPG